MGVILSRVFFFTLTMPAGAVEGTMEECPIVVCANGKLTMNSNPPHAKYSVPEDAWRINRADADEYKEKGVIIGTAKLVTDGGKDQGFVGQEVEGNRLTVTGVPAGIEATSDSHPQRIRRRKGILAIEPDGKLEASFGIVKSGVSPFPGNLNEFPSCQVTGSVPHLG